MLTRARRGRTTIDTARAYGEPKRGSANAATSTTCRVITRLSPHENGLGTAVSRRTAESPPTVATPRPTPPRSGFTASPSPRLRRRSRTSERRWSTAPSAFRREPEEAWAPSTTWTWRSSRSLRPARPGCSGRLLPRACERPWSTSAASSSSGTPRPCDAPGLPRRYLVDRSTRRRASRRLAAGALPRIRLGVPAQGAGGRRLHLDDQLAELLADWSDDRTDVAARAVAEALHPRGRARRPVPGLAAANPHRTRRRRDRRSALIAVSGPLRIRLSALIRFPRAAFDRGRRRDDLFARRRISAEEQLVEAIAAQVGNEIVPGSAAEIVALIEACMRERARPPSSAHPRGRPPDRSRQAAHLGRRPSRLQADREVDGVRRSPPRTASRSGPDQRHQPRPHARGVPRQDRDDRARQRTERDGPPRWLSTLHAGALRALRRSTRRTKSTCATPRPRRTQRFDRERGLSRRRRGAQRDHPRRRLSGRFASPDMNPERGGDLGWIHRRSGRLDGGFDRRPPDGRALAGDRDALRLQPPPGRRPEDLRRSP